ncbi:MAG: nucleoside-diphosphate-sugar epimerase [Verrucomicrobiales bacterium]|jgi:nucleoside-diphosphate-sugar epimerase
MKVIVAGCGFVGEFLRLRLLAAGHEVIGLTLSGSDETEACDLGDSESVRALAAKVGEIDAMVHCASSGRGGDRVQRYRSVYLEGCQNLLDAFPDARLIYTSSTSVYAQVDGEPVDENSPADPGAETGKILRAAEETVVASGGSVARLAGIYGPGRSFLLKRFLEGAAQIDGRWINQIHRDDAASALAFLLENPDSRGIFNIADNTPLWQRDCYEELSQRFGLPVPPEGEPDPNRKRGWTNKRVSNSKLRAAGWAPRYPSYFDALDHDAELVASIVVRGSS